jgi:hypothetical protein
MRKGKVTILLFLAVLLLAGCASRLGYPARTVGVPTPVTLFSAVAPNGTLNNSMSYFARDVWDTLYKKKFEDVVAKIPAERLQRQLNLSFAKDVGKSSNLFTPSSSEITDIGVPYSKTKTDPPAYSGFDFSQYKESIPTQYILALTIDEWGLTAAQLDKDNGPSISLTIQLIDKETNASLWRYNYYFLRQVDKDASEITNPDKVEDMIDRLISTGVDAFFQWLGY